MRPFAVIFSLFMALAILPAVAQDSEQRRPEPTGIFRLIPEDATTDHVLRTREGELPYTATAGTLDLFNPSGTLNAKIFYTAYVAKNGGKNRPLTFAFNGGPGAASAYLHLGILGPRILKFGADGTDGTQPELVDNPDSWLAFTDLVMVDPIGTGWSRATDEDTARRYYGVNADAESLAKAIALYTQKNDRLSSPIYLAGESYGGFRAAKVAGALKENQGILASGLVMISPMIDGRFLPGDLIDPLKAALQLPSLAAAELERQGRFTPEAVREAERFAMTDYLVSVAGAAPEGAQAKDIYARIAALTGLPVDVVAESRGFVSELYTKRAAGPGQVVSPYDAGHAAPDAYPEATADHNDDTVLDGFTRAYGPAFASYARHELGFASDMTYTLLNTEVNRRWDWDGSRSQADASGDLRDLLSVIPSFRVAIMHGYSDILTPYGASRFVLDHLPTRLAEGRTALLLYRGGHMFYTRDDSRQEAARDARAFFTEAGVN
ncbi:carboxypeptidase [Rhizobium sp. RU36D]|uniref:S10 family peptidase n=1 Tax=Rhizobium sp. RU36D TaxID=1907415 RepID=UPI001FCDBE78|nr:carboxypeptidase [Rhizobium sp. RU36D]